MYRQRDLESHLALLEPTVAGKVEEWIETCAAQEVKLLIYCSYRSPQEQAELYERGRSQPGKIATNARPWYSAHQYRRAVDACPIVAGKCLWTPFESRAHEQSFRRTGDLSFLVREWRIFAECAELAGLEWAGRWVRFVEYVHVQDLGGKTISQLYSEREAI